MGTQEHAPAKNPVALALKALGYLTAPTSRPGKLFKKWEDVMTSAMTKLANNDAYLNQAGRAMERAFLARARWNQSFETLLRLWRMPTTSDMDDLRDHLRHLNDQVEALSSQLELMMDELNRSQDGQQQAAEVSAPMGHSPAKSEHKAQAMPDVIAPLIVVPPVAEAASSNAGSGAARARVAKNGTPGPARSSGRAGRTPSAARGTGGAAAKKQAGR